VAREPRLSRGTCFTVPAEQVPRSRPTCRAARSGPLAHSSWPNNKPKNAYSYWYPIVSGNFASPRGRTPLPSDAFGARQGCRREPLTCWHAAPGSCGAGCSFKRRVKRPSRCRATRLGCAQLAPQSTPEAHLGMLTCTTHTDAAPTSPACVRCVRRRYPHYTRVMRLFSGSSEANQRCACGAREPCARAPLCILTVCRAVWQIIIGARRLTDYHRKHHGAGGRPQRATRSESSPASTAPAAGRRPAGRHSGCRRQYAR